MDQLWLWVGFNTFVLALLAVDLGVFHRQAHDPVEHDPLGGEERAEVAAANRSAAA